MPALRATATRSPTRSRRCKPYLWKQVELIEPKVICTLGNFATKLLTRSNRGITQVAGKPQDGEIGGRRVVLYPLFHPAAALRTPATKERLQEDFARLPGFSPRRSRSRSPNPRPRPSRPGSPGNSWRLTPLRGISAQRWRDGYGGQRW